jgi:YbbR domain-containing protein
MRKLILENLGLKISAVLFSVFLWFFVTSRGQSEISFEIPLEFQNIPAGLGIVNYTAKTVDVSIRGQERLIKDIKTSDTRVVLDMSKAKKGEFTYAVNKENVELPYSMTITNIVPSSVKVKIDEVITKTIPVRPSISGLPGKGFYLKSVEVEPQFVIIRGFKADVRRVNELKTEPVDISGLTSSISQEADIDTGGINVKPEAGAVTVKITIAGRK